MGGCGVGLGWLLFSFNGRANRARYWLAALIYVVVMLIVWGVAWSLVPDEFFDAFDSVYDSGLDVAAVDFGALGGAAFLIVVASIIVFISGLAVGAKRLHDRDKSAWWLLLFYVAPNVVTWAAGMNESALAFANLVSFVIFVWAFVELGCLPGTRGPNRFGPDPLDGAWAGGYAPEPPYPGMPSRGARQPLVYDRRRWEALKQVDPDIAAAAVEVRQFGPDGEDQLAERYLALNDKQYLRTLVAQIAGGRRV